VDRAAIFQQKKAGRFPRDAKAHLVARAIDVAPLEFGRCEPEEGRGAAHIGCREIN
jgi:hypothetical protein